MFMRWTGYLLLVVGVLAAETTPYPYPFQFEGLFEALYRAGRASASGGLLARMMEPDDVILEAGAFDGTDTLNLSRMVPAGQVISFEPNPPRYAELVAKTKQCHNIQPVPLALGETNGLITFYVCYGAQYDPIYESASSALSPAESMTINYQGPEIEVPCVILDDWCLANGRNKIDFMWLDLEGYELQVLRNSPRVLSQVKAIYAETNFYEFRKGMTMYQDLRNFLEANGFRLLSHGYYRGTQGNALFVRSDLFDSIVQKINRSLKVSPILTVQ